MKLEFKECEFEVKDADSKSGIIRGFASTFGNIDLGDDVVDPGAFKKTLQENKGVVPILADHDPAKPLGWNVRAEETKDGLFVEGKFNMEDPFAAGRYALARQALEVGAKMGLSIGYGVIKALPDKERPSVRRLKELKLYEYSLVTFPMNTQAMVTQAKTWKAIAQQDALVREILQEAKSRGLTVTALCEALQKSGAAEPIVENDPARICQSLDRLIETLTKGVK